MPEQVRHDGSRKSSRRQRAVTRAAITLFSLLLAGAIVREGYTAHLLRTDPVRAATVSPSDARTALAAARALLDDGAPANTASVQELARRSLARDPTQPGAIEIRALAADPAHQARLFALSNAISRRSLPTRLWRIQHAVDRGDVAGALDDFDIALRTSSAAPATLFPVLAGAASDPTLVRPIARMLDRPSDWRAMFLHYAATRTESAPALANIVLAMRDRDAVTSSNIDQMLIGTLIQGGHHDLARRVAAAFGNAAPDARPIADPSFSDPNQAFPFGWGLFDQGAAGAARMRIGNRPALAWRAVPGGGGTVASQLLTLPARRYMLAATTARSATGRQAPPLWTITCAGPAGRQIALLAQPVERGTSARTAFIVPDGCEAQWIALVVQPTDAPDGQSGAVASIAITEH